MGLIGIAFCIVGVWLAGSLAVSEIIGWYCWPERKNGCGPSLSDFRGRTRLRAVRGQACGRHRVHEGLVQAMARAGMEALCVLLPARAFPAGRHAL